MRNGVRAAAAMIAITSLCVQGCVAVMTKDHERIPRKERKLSAAVTPCIDVDFEFGAVSDTGDVDPVMELESLKKRFRDVQSHFGFLGNAREDHPEAAYRLELRLDSTEKTWGHPELTGLTIFLVPSFARLNITYRATLKTAAGEELYSHAARFKATMIIQLWLLWVSPSPCSPFRT